MSASALHSTYVIDGQQQDFTPAQLLDACTEPSGRMCRGQEGPAVIDETVDPPAIALEPGLRLQDCLDAVKSASPACPYAYSAEYTRLRMACALIDAIWLRGHFLLGNLSLDLRWRWDTSPVGAAASFYASAASAADCMDELDLRIRRYSLSQEDGGAAFFEAVAVPGDGSDDDADPFAPMGSRLDNPVMISQRACPETFAPDRDSWIVYVPFDTADFRLGGSLLAGAMHAGGACVQLSDADYFIDCYEVVREFVEDSLLLSGTTVGEGGLMAALDRMSSEGIGLDADISGIMNAFGEDDRIRLLFGEVPGVLLQIRDGDFDYLDAELLLQDVAFFPLGHPRPGPTEVSSERKSGIQAIIESLMHK